MDLDILSKQTEEEISREKADPQHSRRNIVIAINDAAPSWILTPIPGRDEQKSSLRWLKKCQEGVKSLSSRHSILMGTLIILIFVIGYSVYLGFVFTRTTSGWTALIVLTCIVVFLCIYEKLKEKIGSKVQHTVILPLSTAIDKIWRSIQWYVSSLFYFISLFSPEQNFQD